MPFALWRLAILSLVVVADSHTVCNARRVIGHICKPSDESLCVQPDNFLFYRTRMSRVLLHKNLPFMTPFFDGNVVKELADMEAWHRSGSVAGLKYSKQHLTLALALICEGLLETERRYLKDEWAFSGGSIDVAMELLPAVLSGPWFRIAVSGWPVFGLLARIARALVPPTGAKAKCPAKNPWMPFLSVANATGVDMQAGDNYTLIEIADFRRFSPGFMKWSSACLWDAADVLSIPTGPVCITVPQPGSPKPVVAARDCNARWPNCQPGGPSQLHYRLQLPHRRELTSDTIREEQRPYCALNRLGWVVSEAQELFAKLVAEHVPGSPKRPLQMAEVGSNFGDCAFIVNAVSRHVGWPLRATCFEPGLEAIEVFRQSRRLNFGARSALELREAAVVDNEEKTVEFVVPEYSGVHGDVAGGKAALSTKEAGIKQNTHSVAATRLDREFLGVIDLLLVGTTDGEIGVFQGADRLLSEKRVKSIVTLTWNLPRLQEYIAAKGYHFVKNFQIGVNSLHLLRSEAA